MAIPDVQALKRHRLRWHDLVCCVSLANLCYLAEWRDLQAAATADRDYFRKTPIGGAVWLTLADIAIMAAALAAAVLLVRRLERARCRSGPRRYAPIVRAVRGGILLLGPLLPVLLIPIV